MSYRYRPTKTRPQIPQPTKGAMTMNTNRTIKDRVARGTALAALIFAAVGGAHVSTASTPDGPTTINRRIGGTCSGNVIGLNNNFGAGVFDLTPNGSSATYGVSSQAETAQIRVTVIRADSRGYLQAAAAGDYYGDVSYLNYLPSATPHLGETFEVNLDDSNRFQLRSSSVIRDACVDILAVEQ